MSEDENHNQSLDSVIQVPSSSSPVKGDSEVQPAPNSTSSLREKFAFNGKNLMENDSSLNSKYDPRDITILENMFKTVNSTLIKAVYKSKGNYNLKTTKNYLTELVEKRKKKQVMENMKNLNNIVSNGAGSTSPAPLKFKSYNPATKTSVVIKSSPDPSPQKSSKVVLNRNKTISQKYSAYKEDPVIEVSSPGVVEVESPVKKRRRLVRGTRAQATIVLSDEEDDDEDDEDAPVVVKAQTLNHPNPINPVFIQVDPERKQQQRPQQQRPQQQNVSKKSRKTNYLDDEEEEEINDDFSDDDDVADNSMIDNTELDEYFEKKVLEFLNSAQDLDISDISGCDLEISREIIKKRPFRSINQFESLNFSQKALNSTKRKSKTEGEVISSKANLTLRGYAAVDKLVKDCNRYSDIIAEQINKWGVKVHGVNDELEIVDIDQDIENKNDDENDDIDDKIKQSRQKSGYINTKPRLISDEIDLKNYQQVGLNWLYLLYKNKLSCILADEMGLGKTCQVIAFLSYLKEIGVEKGPHLVVVPSSTLENWLREFNKFSPSLRIEPYYGSQYEREEMRPILYNKMDEIDVLVTTYNLAVGNKEDQKFLRQCGFNCIIFDEGHMLKNSSSERFIKLMKLKGRFRLLLTGTPLQNNLRELMSLLEFILPSMFISKKEDLKYVFSQKAKTYGNDKETHNPLLSERAISKAKKMMAPFILRRKKDQVLKHLPPKHHETVYCELTKTQKEIYDIEIQKGLDSKLLHKARINVIMNLRKAAIHPLLFRHSYDYETLIKMRNDIMKEDSYLNANPDYILEDMEIMSDFELHNLCLKFPTISKYQLDTSKFMDSGKVKQLEKILPEIIKIQNGKILIFSLFTQVLDILEIVLSNLSISFLRLDGSTAVDLRQDLIDKFYESEEIPVFLLSTKAGGFGINLVCANNVIIFDQSFNPHDDKQAEDRAHRVGQTRPVNVIRLISKNTIEENMLQLAQNKLELDKSMSGEQIENRSVSYLEQMVFNEKDVKPEEIKKEDSTDPNDSIIEIKDESS